MTFARCLAAFSFLHSSQAVPQSIGNSTYQRPSASCSTPTFSGSAMPMLLFFVFNVSMHPIFDLPTYAVPGLYWLHGQSNPVGFLYSSASHRGGALQIRYIDYWFVQILFPPNAVNQVNRFPIQGDVHLLLYRDHSSNCASSFGIYLTIWPCQNCSVSSSSD